MLEPLQGQALGRDAVRLHTHRSIVAIAFGVLALVVIWANTIPWLGDGARFPSDYDIMVPIVAGSLVALLIAIRGATGPWSRTDLPRVQPSTGLLHTEHRGVHHRVAYVLAELADLRIEDRVESMLVMINRRHELRDVRFHCIVARNVEKSLYGHTSMRRVRPIYTRLREHVLAAKLRALLATPAVDGDAFRSFDPMAQAKDLLAADEAGYRAGALAILAADREPIVRARARGLA